MDKVREQIDIGGLNHLKSDYIIIIHNIMIIPYTYRICCIHLAARNDRLLICPTIIGLSVCDRQPVLNNAS